MSRKSRLEVLKEQSITIKQLSVAYTFLLCSCVIFLYSVHNVSFNYDGISVNFMSLLFPVLLFLVNVIAKELGYKYGTRAIIISTITLFFYGVFCNLFVTGSFNLFDITIISMAYFITQTICLAVYYYLLVNTRLPILLVVCNYIVSSLIYNILYISLNYKFIMTTEFWIEYILIVLLQGVLGIVLAIFDAIVERGID